MDDDILDLGGLSEDKTNFIPKAEIVYSVSKSASKGGIPGHIYIPDTGNFKSLQVVPLSFKKGRIWFAGMGSKYFCRSDDDINPVQSDSPFFNKQADSCVYCPKAKWKGRNSPPQCSQEINVTFLELNLNKLIQMSFKKYAYKDIITALSVMSERGGASHNTLTVQVQEINSKNGHVYYTPLFLDIRALTEEEDLKVRAHRDIMVKESAQEVKPEYQDLEDIEIEE